MPESVQFLADESCDFAAVRALRAAGHDVATVVELLPSGADGAVLDLAVQASRVVLTEDKDFGQLVYANGAASAGVTFIRFPAEARPMLGATNVRAVAELGGRLHGSFVVIQPGRMRVTRYPEWRGRRLDRRPLS